MLRVHVLTPGFTTPNGRAFLFPLVFNAARIGERGHDLRLVPEATPENLECDVLIIDSKFHRSMWGARSEEVFAQLEEARRRCSALLFFDTGDSTGVLQVAVLPMVDAYYKSQLLRDRQRYLEPMYGQRIFTDYYHREFSIEDERPVWSQPVPDPSWLDKLHVSWNSGLADYRLLGPARMAMYHRLPVRAWLRYPRRFAAPSHDRSVHVSCRMGSSYPRRTVAYQRQLLDRRLSDDVPTSKLSRRAYMAELRDTVAALSPFGWGEVTLKDFEVLLSGALLVKPDMGHLETYPDLYVAGETIMAHRWDLSDLDEVLDGMRASRSETVAVARRGQDLYRRSVATSEGYDAFADRFDRIVRGTMSRR